MLKLNRERKIDLIQRTLGLRHKLKVHDSMTVPETHEEQSLSLIAKWELEDELRAIEEILIQVRTEGSQEKKEQILKLLREGTPLVDPKNNRKT